MRKLVPFIFAVLWITASLHAQPAEVTRVLRNFDFEERRLGNAEDLPMHWFKVEGDGLPHYINGRLTTDRARSGQYSFRFDLNGGSLIYRYDATMIQVQPGAHYRVEGFAQTTPLANARARITAYFLDQDKRPMLKTVHHSNPFASKPGETTWHEMAVELSAHVVVPDDPTQPYPIPKYLAVELELLQPILYASASLGQRTLFNQDIRGTVWFDDITVSQVPKVTMSTDRPGNIFRKGDSMVLKVLVNDRFTDDLAAKLVITDAAGKTVYQRSGALDMTEARTLAPGQKLMSLSLPELPPGWYEAALLMTSKGQYVGRQVLDLVLLADEAIPRLPDTRFGIVATDLPPEGWGDLPQVLGLLSAGRVKLGVWSDAGDVQQLDSGSFDRLLERLGEMRIEPTACLVSLPPPIVDKMQRTRSAEIRAQLSSNASTLDELTSTEANWLQLLKTDPAFWQPSLAYLIARHAAHLQHWQLGADGSDSFVSHPQMREVYDRIYKEFAVLIEKPDLAMPWPAWYELDGKLPATVALHIKPEVLPAQVPLYVKDIQGKAGAPKTVAKALPPTHELSIFLEPLDRDQYGREAQIRDLAQRVVYAISADAHRIDLKLPFTVTREEVQTQEKNEDDEAYVKQPQELLIVIRTLMMNLGGATFKGKVPIADGVEAFLFDRGGQGILVLWDRGVEGGVKQLAINLGDNPQRIDLWGNVTPLLQAKSTRSMTESSTVKLDIGPTPIFLVDIDGQLAQLRASIALDNPLLESSIRPHTRKIRFTNPYRQAISGSFKLQPPVGWTVNPPVQTFSLNPGDTFERDVTIEFPYNSPFGAKTIHAEFQVQAGQNSTFIAPINLKLGLSDVGLQSLALRDGNDVIVQQLITNYGDKKINYTAFAVYPGQGRKELFVTDLAPGKTTIKKYRFPNVKITPDARIRSGVKELEGDRILNDEVPIQ